MEALECLQILNLLICADLVIGPYALYAFTRVACRRVVL